MLGGLKNLFRNRPAAETPVEAAPPQGPVVDRPFLRREPVFDRRRGVAGYLFSLGAGRQAPDPGAAGQRQRDSLLLDIVSRNLGPGKLLVFLPFSSASLDLPAFEQIDAPNLVLLLNLADGEEPESLQARIEALRHRGVGIGLYRQPRHPAFGAAVQFADYAAVDVAGEEAGRIRDFSVAIRAVRAKAPVRLIACNVDTTDDQFFCEQWHYGYFHGRFAAEPLLNRPGKAADPHKAQLLDVLRQVQGDADTAEVVASMKRDPVLSFRIVRYLSSPALGLASPVESLSQAMIVLGRQRLARWLAVMLFSVRDPDFTDWLVIGNALTRGYMMELLGPAAMPGRSADAFFLTGIFSCLEPVLRMPVAEIIGDMPLAPEIRSALLERSGPYMPLLEVAEACEDGEASRLRAAAETAGVTADEVNDALLAATLWASEVTAYWD